MSLHVWKLLKQTSKQKPQLAETHTPQETCQSNSLLQGLAQTFLDFILAPFLPVHNQPETKMSVCTNAWGFESYGWRPNLRLWKLMFPTSQTPTQTEKTCLHFTFTVKCLGIWFCWYFEPQKTKLVHLVTEKKRTRARRIFCLLCQQIGRKRSVPQDGGNKHSLSKAAWGNGALSSDFLFY